MLAFVPQRLINIALLVTAATTAPAPPTSAPTEEEPASCFICGDSSQEVTNLDTIVLDGFLTDDGISCADLEVAGIIGILDAVSCGSLSIFNIATVCGCETRAQEVPCNNMCGSGVATNLDTLVSVPWGPVASGETTGITCGELQQLGLDSGIPDAVCPRLPALVGDECGCPPISNSGGKRDGAGKGGKRDLAYTMKKTRR